MLISLNSLSRQEPSKKVTLEMSPTLMMSKARRKRIALQKPLSPRDPIVPGIVRGPTNTVDSSWAKWDM